MDFDTGAEIKNEIASLFERLRDEGRFHEIRFAKLKAYGDHDPKYPSAGHCENLTELEAFGLQVFEELYFPILEEVLHLLLTGTAEIKQQVAKEFQNLLPTAIWCWRGLTKPLGYAGDYLMMHYIYSFVPAYKIDRYETLCGWAIDKWVLSYGKDVKERTLELACLIQQEVEDTDFHKAVHVLSIACGPFGEIDSFQKLQGPKAMEGSVRFVGIDNDPCALDFVKTRYGASRHDPFASNATSLEPFTIKANIISASRKPGRFPEVDNLPPQDLIYSIGLMDYLEDKYFIQIADWAFDKLQPGGKVVLGNFNLEQNCKAATATRLILGELLDWQLIYRSDEAMTSLLLASKFGKSGGKIHVWRASAGLQLYACAQKPMNNSRL